MKHQDLLQFYVVEYSVQQQAFEVLTVDEMLESNLRCILKHNFPRQYVPVGFAATREQASELVAAFRKSLEDRDEAEFPSVILSNDD